MNSIHRIWNLFLFFSILTLPQLLGVLAYFRIRHYQKFVAHLVGFLIPPSLFFYLSWLFLIYLPNKGHANEGCGMGAVAMGFIILMGTGGQIFFSLMAQVMLRDKGRK